jgi:hypothetical protein
MQTATASPQERLFQLLLLMNPPDSERSDEGQIAEKFRAMLGADAPILSLASKQTRPQERIAVFTHTDGTSEEVRVVKEHPEGEGGGFTIYIPSLQRERQTVAERLQFDFGVLMDLKESTSNTDLRVDLDATQHNQPLDFSTSSHADILRAVLECSSSPKKASPTTPTPKSPKRCSTLLQSITTLTPGESTVRSSPVSMRGVPLDHARLPVKKVESFPEKPTGWLAKSSPLRQTGLEKIQARADRLRAKTQEAKDLRTARLLELEQETERLRRMEADRKARKHAQADARREAQWSAEIVELDAPKQEAERQARIEALLTSTPTELASGAHLEAPAAETDEQHGQILQQDEDWEEGEEGSRDDHEVAVEAGEGIAMVADFLELARQEWEAGLDIREAELMKREAEVAAVLAENPPTQARPRAHQHQRWEAC